METGIYVRVSTEEQAQEGFSIRAQEQKLKDFARIKDWSIFKIYIDEGISGKNIVDRPAINELLEDIKKAKVKNVLVFKIDRLTRSTADLIYLVDLFNQYDCAFNSLMESIDTQTASGRMFLKIIGIFAEFERENIIERTKLGIERKLNEGYSLCTDNPSYGYDRPKSQKIQTINESEAAIVRDIFDMYINQGQTLIGIARRLNVQKIATKHNTMWTGGKIRRLLSNVNYIGDVRHHVHDKNKRRTAKGLHEEIVCTELFDAAQKLLAKNKKASPTKKPREDNYFSGLLVCAKCGYHLRTYNSHKKLKDGTAVIHSGYMCSNRTLKVCTASGMGSKKVEQAFRDYIAQIADFDVTEEIQLAEHEKKKQDNMALIKAYQEKYNRLENKEREALNLYVNDEIGFDSYREIKDLADKDKKKIKEELERLPAIDEEMTINQEDIIKNLNENWELLTDTEKRQFLVQFVEKIVIVNEKSEDAFFGNVKITDIVFRTS